MEIPDYIPDNLQYNYVPFDMDCTLLQEEIESIRGLIQARLNHVVDCPCEVGHQWQLLEFPEQLSIVHLISLPEGPIVSLSRYFPDGTFDMFAGRIEISAVEEEE